MVSDRELNQFGVAFDVQDFLDSVLVESNGVRGYMQVMRHLLHRLLSTSFSQQLQNFALAFSKPLLFVNKFLVLARPKHRAFLVGLLE
jgi:hypothetical protein